MIFKHLFNKLTLVFILAIFLFGPLGLMSCSGSIEVRGIDEDLTECVEGASRLDCDNDGISRACEKNDMNPNDIELLEACDADLDGNLDIACGTTTEGSSKLCDNCIGTANPDQADADADGFGDECDNVNCVDGDGDTVCDSSDNCPNDFNADQTTDIDGDGTGDACDDDKDGDGHANDADNCPEVANVDQTADMDGDGTGDACDDDTDGDGIANDDDACPDQGKSSEYEETVTNPDSWTGCCYDTDGDSVCDHQEPNGCILIDNADVDGDGYVDCADTDNDGISDGDDDDIDGDGLGNDGDTCPENDEDGWSLSVIEIHVDKSSTCTMDDGGSGYDTTFTWNGVSTGTYCNDKRSYTKDELIGNSNTIIIVYGMLTLGAIDPTQRHVKGSWDDIVQQSKAENYSTAPHACTEGRTASSSEFERTVCGTLQSDVDSDGHGNACDAYPSDPSRW